MIVAMDGKQRANIPSMIFPLSDVKRYIGVLGTVIMGNNFSKDLTLPAGTTPTDKYVFGGYSLMMQYGIRF